MHDDDNYSPTYVAYRTKSQHNIRAGETTVIYDRSTLLPFD